MTFKTNDRIFETSITTGTGTYTLDGAQTGFQAFSVIGANNDCPYFATDDTNWEVGIGTVLTGPARLQRTTILASSSAGAAVDWAAGTRKIRCGLPAAMAIPRVLSKSVAGSSNVTLTQDEQRRDVLVFTGLLTGNIDVIVDATLAEWTVFNNTTGAFTLTLKVSGGTGKVVAQGSSTVLRSDGTNVVDSINYLNTLKVPATIGVGGAAPAASGAGISFPAAQSASSDANTLDDYEEGSWTPLLGGTATYSIQLGQYTKVGNLVTFKGHLAVSTIGTGSTSVISGLPFASVNVDDLGCLSVGHITNAANNFVFLTGYVGQNVSNVQIIGIGAAAASTGIFAVFGNSTNIYFSGHYYI